MLNGLNFKLSKEKFCVGLDLGIQTVKAVKLKISNNKAEFCGFALEQAQPDMVSMLKKIKLSLGIDTVNLAFSGAASVIRYVMFPKMNNLELAQSLKFEAQKHIPFSIAEVSLDGYILKDDLPDSKMLVLIAALKKEMLNQRLKLMDEAGLRVNIVDIDSLALVNCFNFNYPREDNPKYKAVALLNIGSQVSNLDILENGLPLMSRDIQIAGNNFTQKLADAFNMDLKAAEEIKVKTKDSQDSSKLTASLESVLVNLAGELRTSFDYFDSQHSSSVGKIFLSGGGSKFSGLSEMLANLLGVEVECWDPLKMLAVADNIGNGNLVAARPQLNVAVGLALRK
jgi:type IV pilus assembly protein PilM